MGCAPTSCTPAEVLDSGVRVSGFGFRVSGLGFGVGAYLGMCKGLEFRVQDLGCRVHPRMSMSTVVVHARSECVLSSEIAGCELPQRSIRACVRARLCADRWRLC
jgi:hypothetical protein